MVSSEVAENGRCSPDSKSCSVIGLPPGNYQLVGWDMDATGRKLIDEICQIAGYTQNSSYSQYVMPYKNLNPVAMKRHKIKVVTIKKFRMLKDSKTNKMIKTKSEFSALTEFLNWLESVKGPDTDGVILIYHEPRKVIPIMLMESLHKYDFLDRFKKVVKGFANGFNIASAKCPNTAQTYSLRMLSLSLLNEEEELGNAANRARLALEIVHHLSSKNQNAEEVSGSTDDGHHNQRTIEFIREFIQPTDLEEQEHQDGKVLFQRQSSLKPIFGSLLRNINRRERQHVSPLRRLLAEAGIDYAQLQEIWANGQTAALEKFIKEKLIKVDEIKIKDLMEILLKHFDPKEPSKNDIKNEQENGKTVVKENGNDCTSENESPDTTTSNSGSSDDIPTSNSALNNNNVLSDSESKVYC